MNRRPPDDGSPGRIIATMVGIVGILLLGSLFWSAIGAMFSAVGDATAALPVSRPTLNLAVTAEPTPRPVPTEAPTQLPTPQPTVAPRPTSASATQAPLGATPAPVGTREPTAVPPTVQPTSEATPTAMGRSPWVLLPQPAPGSKVAPGSVVVEARARGDAPIATIQLELDGAALPAQVEQRSDSIWRGAATVRVGPGQHAARAIVVDAEGRRGAYRWTFEVAP